MNWREVVARLPSLFSSSRGLRGILARRPERDPAVARQATVYKRTNLLLVHPHSLTTTELWIATPPFVKLDVHADPAAVGQAVVSALAASQTSVPHPKMDEWDGVFRPALNLAGVKSLKAFSKGVCRVNIKLENTILTIMPCKTISAKEGFKDIEAKAMQLPSDASPLEIGVAVDQALALCEPATG